MFVRIVGKHARKWLNVSQNKHVEQTGKAGSLQAEQNKKKRKQIYGPIAATESQQAEILIKKSRKYKKMWCSLYTSILLLFGNFHAS